ncbi:MAG: radical SAM protein, partial [Aestuariivirgaceae bacterium]
IRGEANALDIVSRHPIHSLVLVIIMPFYAKAGTFVTPETGDVGRIFLEARRRIPDRQVLLGCARPPGMHKRVTDAYAVMAGLDGIAFPADGSVAVANAINRPYHQEHACCSIKIGASAGKQLSATCAA